MKNLKKISEFGGKMVLLKYRLNQCRMKLTKREINLKKLKKEDSVQKKNFKNICNLKKKLNN